MNQHSNPKIRFKGYDNSLERKTIGDITTSFSGGTPKSSNKTYYEGNIPFIRSGEIKSKQTELFISDHALKDSSAKMVEKGDILYALYGATSGEVAISQINGAINQAILAIKPNSGYSSEFIMNYLKKEKDNILEKYLQGGQGNLSAAIVKSIELSLPSRDEQSAIGSLFRTLDDLLTSYKDNLANYQSLKATMLSKLFPKAGQTVPEIRLDGFEGEWELLEINNLADDFQSGGTPKTNVQEYWDGDIPWIQSSDLETNCLFEIKVQKSISEKGLKNSSAKIIPKDSIAVVTRVGVGKLAVMRHEYATSQDFLSLSNLKSNIEFTAYLLYRLLQKEVTQLQGTSIKGITKVELLSKKVLIPSLSEQQAIGIYFSNLDSLIIAHQEKITQLETLKKKLLQDMFI